MLPWSSGIWISNKKHTLFDCNDLITSGTIRSFLKSPPPITFSALAVAMDKIIFLKQLLEYDLNESSALAFEEE